ncbi:membrane protein FAM174A-like [Anneissia japonica]|uniref:membrane protein FAM174A-like n=1 Tax=Anneissia japonica TaxID=1529436 RepID=UPI0014256CBD|nr:membrane protein FAM174A-like [Anneissia japonica]
MKKRATATETSPSKVTPTTVRPSATVLNATKLSGKDQNGSSFSPANLIPDGLKWSPDLLKRMLVVLLSITAIAVFYFIFRTLRLRRNRKTRKYGVLTTNSDHLEMAPLDQEEDDEDMTVFEANSRYK